MSSEVNPVEHKNNVILLLRRHEIKSITVYDFCNKCKDTCYHNVHVKFKDGEYKQVLSSHVTCLLLQYARHHNIPFEIVKHMIYQQHEYKIDQNHYVIHFFNYMKTIYVEELIHVINHVEQKQLETVTLNKL